jgi:hypothetical protein
MLLQIKLLFFNTSLIFNEPWEFLSTLQQKHSNLFFFFGTWIVWSPDAFQISPIGLPQFGTFCVLIGFDKCVALDALQQWREMPKVGDRMQMVFTRTVGLCLCIVYFVPAANFWTMSYGTVFILWRPVYKVQMLPCSGGALRRNFS